MYADAWNASDAGERWRLLGGSDRGSRNDIEAVTETTVSHHAMGGHAPLVVGVRVCDPVGARLVRPRGDGRSRRGVDASSPPGCRIRLSPRSLLAQTGRPLGRRAPVLTTGCPPGRNAALGCITPPTKGGPALSSATGSDPPARRIRRVRQNGVVRSERTLTLVRPRAYGRTRFRWSP
jgi:hypothetical protein